MLPLKRTCTGLLIALLCAPGARALFNFNDGTDLVFVNATYSIGWDSNVFTRKASRQSYTQSLSLGANYTRQAGLITINAGASVSTGRFENIRNQDFTDPALSLAFRKRYGRTTGSLSFSGSRVSQPDPDAGQRTKSWNIGTNLDLRYPVNDRYYFTNSFHTGFRFYTDNVTFSDLNSYTDSVAVNYVYTSKLDLNASYGITISDTSKHSHAYDHSLMLGASGGILPKLSGSVRMGVVRRDSTSRVGGREQFYSFASGTSVKWLYSRKLSFSGDLSDDFSTTSTDINVNRLSGGLRTTAAFSSRYIPSAGVTYTISKFLGKAGAGRRDDMLQFDASIGVAFTTHIRSSLSYFYSINWSNAAGADFERQGVSLTLVATY